MEPKNQPEGAVSGDADQTTPTTPEPTPAPESLTSTAKVEIVDGKVVVDGKKFVAESDLIAAKRSLEQKLEEQQTIHNEAIDKAKVELSEAQQAAAAANAKVQQLEQASTTGAVSDEDAARSKQEIEAAKSSAEQAAAKALELRRQNIILKSGGAVTAEQLEGKTEEQLDSFEEALKALAQSRGIGNYATGGTGGGAAPETPMDRAARILQSTPVRGTRTAETK